MNSGENISWFSKSTCVVSESLKFKIKLAIGEDAYTSLKIKNKVSQAWDTLGAAGTAASVARSSFVATKFFAPSGFLATIGIGTATTPIGWVVAAAVVSGGAWIGITQFLKKQTDSRVRVIPDFLNTPIDVLAVGLFDLMVPLALKVAAVDGNIDQSEREFISNYFIKEWGYDSTFVEEGVSFVASNLTKFKIRDVAHSLAEFQMFNRDCNFQSMSEEIVKFLEGIMESDGYIDEREEMVIKEVGNIFTEAGKINIKKRISFFLKKINQLIMIKIYSILKKRSHNELRIRMARSRHTIHG